MSFSEPFIRRPVATTLLMIALMLLGAVAYRQLNIASLPAVDLPTVFVSAVLPGASPETMSASVATPLERQFGQMAGLSEMTSVNRQGASLIVLQFDLSIDPDAAGRAVQAAINAAATTLPADLPSQPIFRKANPAQRPILILAALSETVPSSQVFDAADRVISQRLAQIEGVSQVSINGAEKTAIRVDLDPAALAARGLGTDDVRDALAAANVNLPKGSIDGARQSYAITVDDQLFDAQPYRDLIIARNANGVTRLGDVATVSKGVANTKLAGWFGDRRAVILYVLRQPQANEVETIERVKAALPDLQRWIPADVRIEVLSDRSIAIREAVAELQLTLALSTALVIVVIYAFLRRVSATLIPSLTIPVALAGTFAVMYAADASLNTLTLMALTIATGFVVDDAIVMVENIARHREAGVPPFAAALKGAREIGFTIVSITVSLVAVFIPVLFMGGIFGKFFREFGIALCAAVVVSALVSLTLTPMLAARFLDTAGHGRAEPRWLTAIGRLVDGMMVPHRAALDWVLRHKRLMLVVTLLTVGGTIWLYIVIPKGTIPQQDFGLISAYTETAQDIAFPTMEARQREVVRQLLADPAIDTVTSYIGANAFGGAGNTGRLQIVLKPLAERGGATTQQVIDRLRPTMRRIQGITTFMRVDSDVNVGGRSSTGAYQFTLLDDDYRELRAWAPRVAEAMRALPQLTDVDADQKPGGLELKIEIDREAAARLGLTVAMIDQTLYDAFGQRQVASIHTERDEYKVVMELEPRFQDPETALQVIRITGPNGAQIPLSSVARLVPGTAPLSIPHQDGLPATTISFNLKDKVALSEATSAIERAFYDLGPPAGLRAQFAGDAAQLRQFGGDQMMLLIAALVTIYIVLGVLYESAIHPLTILSTIPSAGLGALLALLLCDIELSVIATIGILLLVGIVKKNAILMIDFAIDAERRRGLSPVEAIREAALVRFRPITMTTMAAVLGSMPLALDASNSGALRQPLGIAVVGGLIVSQALTLYTTPIVYLALDRLRWRKRRGERPLNPLPSPVGGD